MLKEIDFSLCKILKTYLRNGVLEEGYHMLIVLIKKVGFKSLGCVVYIFIFTEIS